MGWIVLGFYHLYRFNEPFPYSLQCRKDSIRLNWAQNDSRIKSHGISGTKPQPQSLDNFVDKNNKNVCKKCLFDWKKRFHSAHKLPARRIWICLILLIDLLCVCVFVTEWRFVQSFIYNRNESAYAISFLTQPDFDRLNREPAAERRNNTPNSEYYANI